MIQTTMAASLANPRRTRIDAWPPPRTESSAPRDAGRTDAAAPDTADERHSGG
ncbi:hypothetical protein [Actinomadura sp. 9N407]|uniref:hypothetical protein n=1 Tax=Actinomadura sp. 9N407 TaxID=3375154 RepID=UPI00379634EA